MPPERAPDPEPAIREIVTHAAWRAAMLAVARQLSVVYGVRAIEAEVLASTGHEGSTDMMKIHRLGEDS